MVEGFIDNNKTISEVEIPGSVIYSFEDFQKLWTEKQSDESEAEWLIAIAASNQYVTEMAEQLYQHNIIDHILLSPSYYFEWYHDTAQADIPLEKLLIPIDIKKPRLRSFQFHAADSCNLNCKRCGHFSNLVSKDSQLPALEEYCADLEQLKKLYWGVERIVLLGGEPLLNPQLDRFMDATRHAFPDAKLEIYTNGILIPVAKNEFFDSSQRNYVYIHISLYPPTAKMFDKIEEKLLSYGDTIKYEKSVLIEEFFKSLMLEPKNDMKKSFEECISKNCTCLRNGKISSCPLSQCLPVFNAHFNTDIPTYGIYDIYKETDGRELNSKLSSPTRMCEYCKPRQELQYYEWNGGWGSGGALMEDWIIDS